MKLYAGEKEGGHHPHQQKPPSKTKAKTKKTRKKTAKRSSFLWTLARTCLMLGIWGLMALGLLVLWFSHDLPDLKNLQGSTRKPSVVIQTYDGAILKSYGDLYEDMVKVQELPPYVPQALMAVEDRRFYHHFGVDVIGLLRAAYTNYRAQRVVQGGSTLTQQLAKNILFTQGSFDTRDRSFKRKIQEVILSLWLEWNFTKDQILTMYLNRVYFGAGTYGIDAAARRYFNKSARNLTVFESAVIAGLLKAPSKYSPAHNPKLAKKRAKLVLELMVEAGFLKEFQSYLDQGEKELSDASAEKDQGMRYFADWVYEQVPTIVGETDKDLIVITTFDQTMQKQAEKSCTDLMETMGKQLKASEVAFVAMTPDGAVKAMVGGQNYGVSQFNRVTQALRQPGSAFKTFIYLAALESGLTPESMMDDSPVVIGDWRPGNYKWQSRGMISLKEGLTYSVNSVSIRLTQLVGPAKVAEVAKRLGITSTLNNDLSISLGTGETTLLEMTTSYATFANQGRAVWPYGILEIRDKDGAILYSHSAEPGKVIVNATTLHGIRGMLRNVIENGTGRAANVDPTVSGKTGSNADKDAWFFAYREPEANGTDSDGVVVGVWAGNDNNKPMAKASTGGRMPARIAAAFFKSVGAIQSSDTGAAQTQSYPTMTFGDPPKEAAKDSGLNAYLKKL
ncbi:MAG: PBP1A family penicillin-binding protein [Alphaproteobacteria bacterium]|nr:PBP1A family penicillin-binding protein [Alphaproteobacteria bacterium]